jgi:SAM-dependent methyltransferase
MLDIDPDEQVTLLPGRRMSARSAVQKVMMEWSAVDKRSATIACADVITRNGTPSALNISDIAQLWAKSSFQAGMRRSAPTFYYLVGVVLLFVAKFKHLVEGYKTPKPGVLNDQESIRYDMHIADAWLDALDKYLGPARLQAADVLELGPGSDLGIGVYLISKGARTYCALDAINLAGKMHRGFYEALIAKIVGPDATPPSAAESKRLSDAFWGPDKSIEYIVDPDFDIVKSLKGRSFDIIFSNAAFEHFDDVERALADVSAVAKPNAALVCCVDLMTHTRWIRQHDPNNIYRYADWLYRLAGFKGIPNRIRPRQYRAILEAHGWTNVMTIPDLRLHGFDTRSLAKRFRDPANEMDFLTITIVATKSG